MRANDHALSRGRRERMIQGKLSNSYIAASGSYTIAHHQLRDGLDS
jgi:hypothetical protein